VVNFWEIRQFHSIMALNSMALKRQGVSLQLKRISKWLRM